VKMRLPLLTARDLAVILVRLGFRCLRQRGSHLFFKHADGRTTVIPNHPGEKLDRGLLHKIMKHDVRLSREEFLKLL